jgi:hypothetical protein
MAGLPKHRSGWHADFGFGSGAAVQSLAAHSRSTFNCGRSVTPPKAAVIARTVRAEFRKRSDRSRQDDVTTATHNEERRHAAAQPYMATAPPSTWISEPVM